MLSPPKKARPRAPKRKTPRQAGREARAPARAPRRRPAKQAAEQREGFRAFAREPFPVVAMGASAGGLEAFQQFFAAMPPDGGMAFVLAQHLDPRHHTLMPELLGRTTSMPVEEVRDETPVRPNQVYVIPPAAILTIEGGILRVRTPPADKGARMPIDSLFHSLAEDQGPNAVCILFSGSGSDGTLGLRAVKEHGGMAMAQSPESAKHDSILRSAIATGLVDHVLPPDEIPVKLLEYAAYLSKLRRNAAGLEETGEHLARICDLLRRRTGHDFSQYKTNTLARRIQRRMQVLQVPSAVGYVARLRNDPKEAEQLFRDLLIGVTHFFRDPHAFEALAKEVIPRIVSHAGVEGAIRVWTPGCATGEEAYSVAILLKEEMLRRESRAKVQVFAGDIDDEALEFARAGRYPEGVVQHVTPERLERFFVKHKHTYQVVKEIREMCLFSTHNLIRDPPFSRLDLVVCRNLLIYLESDVQRHVTTLFHYALRPDGYLFLGPAEGVAGPPDLFSTIDKKNKIYQRNETVTRPPLHFVSADRHRRGRARPSDRAWTPRVATPAHADMVGALERLLLDHYAPAWVIVNGLGEAVYVSPRTGKYLELAPGVPSMDVVGMARKGLRVDLRTALYQAVKEHKEVVREGLQVPTDGSIQRINLVVRPISEVSVEPALFLVVFQEVGPPRAKSEAAAPAVGHDDSLVHQLEGELRTTKEHLQATVEEVETSNEELKSSNEELLSTNEELQSANEELQTSKEELQSVNEELETINSELNKKVEELDLVNSDLQNLLQSTQIPTLFVDNHLRIKRFTEAALPAFNLIDTDVGRPISDIVSRFEGNLISDLKEVLRTLVPRERQVTLADGTGSYFMRILPYRRLDNVIDGLVVTYMDMTEQRRVEDMQTRLGAIVESSQDAIVGRNLEGTITSWNPAAARMFGYSAEEAIGQPMSLIMAPEQQDELEQVTKALRRSEPVAPFESVRLRKDGRQVSVSVAISPIKSASGTLIGASAIFRDITDLKRARQALEEETRRKDEFLALLSHELRNPLAPLRNSLEILRSEADPKRKDASLEVMNRQLAHMTSLVDQLLDASRISSGKIVLQSEELDLVDLAGKTAEDQRPIIEASGLTLKLELSAKPVPVSGDPVRLAQIVSNLLANAAKFTDVGGTVTLVARMDARHGSAELIVRDSGIGMDQDTINRLFTPFTQASRSLDRTRGGLGLGLALVRALVASHGGSIQALSAGRGRGSEFVVRLPLALPTARKASPPPPAPPKRASRRYNVLLVEDNEDAADTLRTLLELAGYTVDVARDGKAAVQKARTFKPEVVLCDIGLPGDMDGYSVAAALRQGGDGRPPYLIALTGYGQTTDRDKARQAGFHRHLTKPADPDTLRRVLEEIGRQD